MKTLIVLEKEKVSPKFQAALKTDGGNFTISKKERYAENDKYIITWLEGHSIGLKEPRDYPETPKMWSEIPLPWKPERFEYKVRDPKEAERIRDQKKKEEIKRALQRKKDIFFSVSKQMKRDDVELIINACDAEREGELIFWEMYDYLKLNKKNIPVKRFFESTVLKPENIQRIMKSGLKGKEFYETRKKAAYARAYADLLLGMNMTIGFSVKAQAGRQLNMGRVITPIVAIIVNRENEIRNFVSQKYIEIEADFGKYTGKWFKDKLSETKIESEDLAKAIVDKVTNKTGTVIKKDVVEKRVPHELFYSQTALGTHANRKFGYDTNFTLDVAQKLYDQDLTSYPRTSSKYIRSGNTEEIVPTLKQIMKVPEYEMLAKKALNAWTTKEAKLERVINDNDTSDHHAVIPVKETEPNLSRLSDAEKNIYDLIVRRYLSAFYPPAIYEKTDVVTEVEKETFKTSGSILIDRGWKVVYGDQEEDDGEEETAKGNKDVKLPPIEKGEKNDVKKLKKDEKETKPPKRYTEGDLSELMESPGKLLDDDELKKAIKSSGIGTDATRASHLKRIKDVKYVTVEKKRWIPTEIAMKVIEIAPEELKSPIITAEWESKLRAVEVGKYPYEKFMTEIEEWIDKNIGLLRNMNVEPMSRGKVPVDAEVVGKCPDCEGDVYKRKVNVRDKKTGKTVQRVVYSCVNNTKESKCFSLWEIMFKKKIPLKNVKEILNKKVTSEIAGLKSNSGDEFKSKLKWNSENKRIELERQNNTKSSQIQCPFCKKGHITENTKAFGCSNWKNNCSFTIWKNESKQLNFKIIEALIKKGESDKITDFKRNGKTYTGVLVLDMENKKIKTI